MKNIMKAAHQLTKKIKAEFPNVDYKTQLGICIAYLSNKEEEVKMVELKGSEKQIKFATDIRNYVIYQLQNSEVDGVKKEKFISALEKQGNAKFIIDNFINTFKIKDVRAIALDYFKYNELSKVTQKELKSFQCTAKTENYNLKDVEFVTEKIEKSAPVEIKKPIKEENKASEKQISYIKKLYENTDLVTLDIIYKNMYSRLESLTTSQASTLIDELQVHQKVRCQFKPHYFNAKYETFDCETHEKIEVGELVWKDEDGIHRADNY